MSTATATLLAFCASTLPTPDDRGAPEWIHILPAGQEGRIETNDKRGPYLVSDAAAIIKRSLQQSGGRLPIDENHATDLAAKRGEPAPARGWIVALEERADGVWGQVEWTEAGKALVADRAYSSISPVILHDKAKRVWSILRASLVNNANLRGLAALHQENEMTLQQRIAEMLGLGADASEDELMAALEKAVKTEGPNEAAMNAALPKVAKALNLAEDADLDTVLGAINEAPDNAEIVALQSQLGDLTTQLNAVTQERARECAEAFVDEAMEKGRVGVNAASRDRLIAMHQKDPQGTEALVNGFPTLTGTTITDATPPADGQVALNAEQAAVAAQLGMTQADYAKALSADQKETV